MALDNRAVPKYYGEFREKVLKGLIPVCAEISLEMNRTDALIEDPAYYYDGAAVEAWIAFCEGELTLTDGSPLHLLDSFKLWGESLHGWFYFVEQEVFIPGTEHQEGYYKKIVKKKRLRTKQYLIVTRGAAKTMYASTHPAKEIAVGAKTKHMIATAPTMRQAEEIISPIKTAITISRGPWLGFLTEGSIFNTTGSKTDRVKIASTKKGIENFMTNSLFEVRPMSIDKLQGFRPAVAVVDEWLSSDIKEDVIGAIEQGSSKLDDYYIIACSSEGTIRNGVGDSIKMELMKILKNEYLAPHVSIWHYKLDHIDEVAHPELWLKANPNLGRTVKYEAYHQDVQRAENNPSVRNDIMAKRFGLPMEGLTYFFTYDEIQPGPIRDYWNSPVVMGMDLSQGDDFCSFLFLVPLGGERFGIDTINFITEHTLSTLHPAMRLKYETFIQEKSLLILAGTVLNMMQVYDLVEEHILEKQYDVVGVGYDPYNAREFIHRWTQENGEHGVEKVIQGSKTESVPLGELKKLVSQGLLQFGQTIMSFTMGNAITLEDTNGNRKLWKKKSEQKIDCVAALIDAYVAYKRNLEDFM